MPVQVARSAPGWNGANKLCDQYAWDAAELQKDLHVMTLGIKTWSPQLGAKGRARNCAETKGYSRNLRNQLWGWGGETSKIGPDTVNMNYGEHNIIQS